MPFIIEKRRYFEECKESDVVHMGGGSFMVPISEFKLDDVDKVIFMTEIAVYSIDKGIAIDKGVKLEFTSGGIQYLLVPVVNFDIEGV